MRRTTDGKIIRSLVGHTDDVLAVAFSPDGKLLASGSTDRTVKVWQMSDGQLITTLTATVDTVMSISWSPQGHLLAVGDSEQLTMWQAQNWDVSRTFAGGAAQVDFSPDGLLVAGIGLDTVHIRRVSDGKLLLRLEADDVGDFAWSPDGQWVAFGNYGNPVQDRAPEVHVYSVIDGRLVVTLTGFPSTHGVFSIAWSSDGRTLAAGSGKLRQPFVFPNQGWITLWRVTDWQLLKTIQAHKREIHALTFTPDSAWLISGSLDGKIKWWSLKSFNPPQ